MLENWFQMKNKEYLSTRQPTNAYRKDDRVRGYLEDGNCPDMKVLALLSAADRKWHMATEVEPALQKGVAVITDRYIYSTLAYFSVRGLDIDYVQSINDDLRLPDVTIFLDVDPHTSLKRIKKRDEGKLKYEEKSVRTLMEVREAFLSVLPSDVLIVNGEQDPSSIHEKLIEHISPKIMNHG